MSIQSCGIAKGSVRTFRTVKLAVGSFNNECLFFFKKKTRLILLYVQIVVRLPSQK
jgi:hypothetical protein